MAHAGYGHYPLHSFKQHEHSTFYGFVMAMLKWVPNLGMETRVLSLLASPTAVFKDKSVAPGQLTFLVQVNYHFHSFCLCLTKALKKERTKVQSR